MNSPGQLQGLGEVSELIHVQDDPVLHSLDEDHFEWPLRLLDGHPEGILLRTLHGISGLKEGRKLFVADCEGAYFLRHECLFHVNQTRPMQ